MCDELRRQQRHQEVQRAYFQFENAPFTIYDRAVPTAVGLRASIYRSITHLPGPR